MKYTKILTLVVCVLFNNANAKDVSIFIDNDLESAKVGVAAQPRETWRHHPESILSETMARKHQVSTPKSERDETGAKELHRRIISLTFQPDQGYHAVQFYLFREGVSPILKTLILTEEADSFLLKIERGEDGTPVLSPRRFLF